MVKTLINVVIVGIVLFLMGCPTKEELARKQEYKETVNKAKSIRYRCPYQEAWNALYSVVAENYSIARESESKGYIESDWKIKDGFGYRYRIKVSSEILGDSLYRIVIRCPRQRKKGEFVEGKFEYEGDWEDYSDDDEKADNFYYKVYERLKVYGVE